MYYREKGNIWHGECMRSTECLLVWVVMAFLVIFSASNLSHLFHSSGIWYQFFPSVRPRVLFEKWPSWEDKFETKLKTMVLYSGNGVSEYKAMGLYSALLNSCDGLLDASHPRHILQLPWSPLKFYIFELSMLFHCCHLSYHVITGSTGMYLQNTIPYMVRKYYIEIISRFIYIYTKVIDVC